MATHPERRDFPQETSPAETARVTGDAARPEAQFFVPPSASIQERLPPSLKYGDSFALFDAHGDVVGAMQGPEGIYYRDTRHLSYFRLTICGNYPMLLGTAIDDRLDALVVDLTNPDISLGDGAVIPNDVIHIRRIKFLTANAVHERIALRNFDEKPHRLTLEFAIGCDFQDMFEVRGEHRVQRGQKLASTCSADRIVHSYRGLDEVTRHTVIRFEPAPKQAREHRVEFEIDLEPGERRVLFFLTDFSGNAEERPARAFFKAFRSLHSWRTQRGKRQPQLRSSNAVFNETLSRSLADLTTLTTETPQGPCAYAGIPWYCTLFGRDSLITALQLLWYDSSLARGTLRRLAYLQATTDDPVADAEPGKILHETRNGEMANLGEVPFGLYYGSVDSTPLFVFLAGEYFARTQDEETIAAIWPQIEAALGWIESYGDRDGDGFFEYGARTGQGLRNQGWKDSHDAISHADGRLAEGPITVVEMQAYVYGAWQAAARLFAAQGNAAAAAELNEKANDLRHRFDQTFFDRELGTYVLALDGEKMPCRVVASNTGHALLTGIAEPEKAKSVARRLMAKDCFCGWGIRTLSSREKRYNPMSYHNGSVWPHDNALIAAGFARYGLGREARHLFTALFDAASHFDQHRIPELFCGFTRTAGRGPTLYPVACAPQAWSSATPLYLLQSVLGLRIDRPGHVEFSHPDLPDFITDLSIDGLRCGDASVDLDIQKQNKATSVFVRNRRGNISVTTSG